MRASLLVAIGLMVLNCSACATIVNGQYESVRLLSDPLEAKVVVDGGQRGRTPDTVELKRRESHTIVFKKEGYEDRAAVLVPRFSWWTAGNILIGGIIGIAVDAYTGSMWRLSEDKIQMAMVPIEPRLAQGGVLAPVSAVSSAQVQDSRTEISRVAPRTYETLSTVPKAVAVPATGILPASAQAVEIVPERNSQAGPDSEIRVTAKP
jgi:hypothetical protein